MNCTPLLLDIAAIAALALLVLNILGHFKRKPIDAELAKLLQQMREEVNHLRIETNSQFADVRHEIGGAHRRVDLFTRDLNDKMQQLPGQGIDLLNKNGVLGS